MLVTLRKVGEVCFRFLGTNGFSCKRKEWKIYCCGLALSSEHDQSNMKISRRHLADCVKKLHQKACRTCSTIILLHSANQINWFVTLSLPFPSSCLELPIIIVIVNIHHCHLNNPHHGDIMADTLLQTASTIKSLKFRQQIRECATYTLCTKESKDTRSKGWGEIIFWIFRAHVIRDLHVYFARPFVSQQS